MTFPTSSPIAGAVTLPSLDPDLLRARARWIRDKLDPLIARHGPSTLAPDDVLELDEFFRHLLAWPIPLDTIRYSRIHLAVLEIAGRATRWPNKLIDRCDELIKKWQSSFGPVKELGTPLYEKGGRLHGVAKPEDLSQEKLLLKWLRQPGVKASPARAMKHGNLEFEPGDWWINSMFAFRDGIIDSGDPQGGITADAHGAYAILMTDADEISAPSPELLTYRARSDDRGRYKMTNCTPESRLPIRVLRSHSLHSFWSPRAGIRYDGLHKVIGWSIVSDPTTGSCHYDLSLQRHDTGTPMDIVLLRPWAEEVEDYREYKRIRQHVRERQHPPNLLPNRSSNKPSTDGTADGSADDAPSGTTTNATQNGVDHSSLPSPHSAHDSELWRLSAAELSDALRQESSSTTSNARRALWRTRIATSPNRSSEDLSVIGASPPHFPSQVPTLMAQDHVAVGRGSPGWGRMRGGGM